MTSEDLRCRIWGDAYPATGYSVPHPSKVVVHDSPRAGGGYIAFGRTKPYLEEMDDSEKARLTTILIDLRSIGDAQPDVTYDIICEAKKRAQLPAYKRAERLLRFIASEAEFIASRVNVSSESHRAYAWSESIRWEEIDFCLDYLEGKGWIKGNRRASGAFIGNVTVDGHLHIADSETVVDSSQAFVAMWFDDSMNVTFEQGIKPGVLEAGYSPLKINEKPDLNKIDDEIIGEIRRSRFLVADFTHGEAGARGGVYFEAGFALGLDIPVIFTCRSDMVDKLHFDTRQYAHIVWETPDDLRRELRNRVLARIGKGPNPVPIG